MNDVQVILYFFSRNKSFYVFSSHGVRPWYVIGSSPLNPPNQMNPSLAWMGPFQNVVLNCPLLVYYISNDPIFLPVATWQLVI